MSHLPITCVGTGHCVTLRTPLKVRLGVCIASPEVTRLHSIGEEREQEPPVLTPASPRDAEFRENPGAPFYCPPAGCPWQRGL